MISVELKNSIQSGKLSHAYLFTNRRDALDFIEALKPDKSDLNIVSAKDGRLHIVTDDIEKLQEEIRFKPFGLRRVVFIDGADNMQSAPQNKLLKTLEEPPANTILVLYAERRDALLPTVLSRCTEIACADSAMELDSESIRLAQQFYQSWQSGALFFELKAVLSDIPDDKEQGRDKALGFLDALENLLREELLRSLDIDKIGPAIKLTEETRRNIKSSYSVAYAIKALALNI